MTEFDLLLAAAGLFLAGVIKGATGLGYSTCALPFLVASIGLTPAMSLVTMPAMATNISLALGTGHLRETIWRFKLLYIAMLPGIAVGLALLLWVSQSAAVRLLGGVMVAYVVLALIKPSLTLPAHFEGPLQIPTGFCNGIIAGLTGSQVMPLFPYVMALRLDADRMIQAINLAVLIASLLLSIGLASTGLMSLGLFLASVAAMLPALVGVEVGARARTLIPVASVRTVALLTLLAMGIIMLLR